MSVTTSQRIDGIVGRGFEAVREAFADNFYRRGELGGACCAYHRGEKVVDLWGGIRNKQTGEPWERNTMVIVYSATKGLAAMTLAIAHSRGWLDYEERVCAYWPEFAQQGKERITVRQLLAHQAGLFALDEPVDRSVVADLDRLAVVLARQKPAWEPGTRQAYHAITLGFYEGELLRRIDPQHRSLGQFFQDEIASPLGLDVYIRLPEEIPNSRLATIARPGPIEMLLGFPLRLTLDAMNRRSKIVRALRGSEFPHDEQRVYARNLEVPSGGAVGTARAIAHAYSVFATGGHELGLRQETLDLLAAPAIPPTRGFHDECLKGDVQFSLGFMKPSPVWPFGSAQFVRIARSRRLARLCRSDGRRRLRVRDEPDGDASDRRPAGCGAQRRALRRYSGSSCALGERLSRRLLTGRSSEHWREGRGHHDIADDACRPQPRGHSVDRPRAGTRNTTAVGRTTSDGVAVGCPAAFGGPMATYGALGLGDAMGHSGPFTDPEALELVVTIRHRVQLARGHAPMTVLGPLRRDSTLRHGILPLRQTNRRNPTHRHPRSRYRYQGKRRATESCSRARTMRQAIALSLRPERSREMRQA